MAGSLNHIVNDDGTFKMSSIENMGDAREALEECHQIIADLSSRWGGTSVLMPSMDRLGFVRPKAAPVLQEELLGANSPVRKALAGKAGT